MATSYKAIELAHQIASNLKLRLPALTITEGFDTDESPTIQVGAGTAGSAGGFIKVRPVDWPLAKDSLGLTAPTYVPSVIQIGLEANPAGAGADINDWATLMALIGEAVWHNATVEIFNSANGTAPTAATLVAANLQATFDSEIQYPMTSAS